MYHYGEGAPLRYFSENPSFHLYHVSLKNTVVFPQLAGAFEMKIRQKYKFTNQKPAAEYSTFPDMSCLFARTAAGCIPLTV